jgi:acyl carrier protein
MNSEDSAWKTLSAELIELLRNRTLSIDTELKPNYRLIDDLNLDSIDMVELRATVEEYYATEIDDPDWSNIHTLDDLVRLMADLAVTNPNLSQSRVERGRKDA